MSLFPVAEKRAEQVLPVFQAELARKATLLLERPAARSILDEARCRPREPDRVGTGMLAERFAFCQTMPLDEFLTTAEALRNSGYRPMRFRPYADGSRAGRGGLDPRRTELAVASGLTAEEVRQQDERNRKAKFLPVDVAGYVATEKDSKPADAMQRSGSRNPAMTTPGSTSGRPRRAGRSPGSIEGSQADSPDSARHARAEGRTRYCGVWGSPAGAAITGQTYRDQFEGNFEQNQAEPERPVADRPSGQRGEQAAINARAAQADLQSAEKKLKTKPDDPDARWLGLWRTSGWERTRRHSTTFRS